MSQLAGCRELTMADVLEAVNRCRSNMDNPSMVSGLLYDLEWQLRRGVQAETRAGTNCDSLLSCLQEALSTLRGTPDREADPFMAEIMLVGLIQMIQGGPR